jgi:hypothetical protein
MEVVLHEITRISGEITNDTLLELEPCEHRHFPQMTKDEFTKSTVKDCKCLKANNINLMGYWFENLIRYFDVKLSMCIGKSYCLGKDEIRSYIQKRWA